MREFVLALRAIWDSWQHGSRLNFNGEFYQHTLSSPLFDPGPSSHRTPRVFLAAVGPRMSEVAGEVADGLFCHTFTSPSYIAEVTLPALRRGLAVADRVEGDVEVTVPVMLATGPSGCDLGPEVERVRRQIAFYSSTPTYRGVLDHHGWGELHDELHRLSVEQRWDDMTRLISDDMVNTLAVVADADKLSDVLLERFGGLVSGLRLNVPYTDDPDTWASVIAELKEPAP
jgi:probable F420-dependent oxidoreductase